MTSTPDAPVRTVSLAVGEVVGEAVNSWKVLRHIAEGGFSSVYAVPTTRNAGRLWLTGRRNAARHGRRDHQVLREARGSPGRRPGGFSG